MYANSARTAWFDLSSCSPVNKGRGTRSSFFRTIQRIYAWVNSRTFSIIAAHQYTFTTVSTLDAHTLCLFSPQWASTTDLSFRLFHSLRTLFYRFDASLLHHLGLLPPVLTAFPVPAQCSLSRQWLYWYAQISCHEIVLQLTHSWCSGTCIPLTMW